MNYKVLIIGAKGYIGSKLVNYLSYKKKIECTDYDNGFFKKSIIEKKNVFKNSKIKKTPLWSLKIFTSIKKLYL